MKIDIKPVLLCFFLLFLCVFRSFADEINSDEIYINEVINDAEYKYFVLYQSKSGTGVCYISRFKETPVFNERNGRVTVYTSHKSTRFDSRAQAIEAIKTQTITTQSASSEVSFETDQKAIVCCNFEIKTNDKVIAKAHSWKKTEWVYSDHKVEDSKDDAGTNDNTNAITDWIKKIYTGITKIPETLLEGIKTLFIPSEEYMNNFVNKMQEKFTIQKDAEFIMQKINNTLKQSESAPVIYITTSQTGRVQVLDFSIFASHIDEIRKFTSAFLIVGYFWLVVKQLPSIIGGQSMINDTKHDFERYEREKAKKEKLAALKERYRK